MDARKDKHYIHIYYWLLLLSTFLWVNPLINPLCLPETYQDYQHFSFFHRKYKSQSDQSFSLLWVCTYKVTAIVTMQLYFTIHCMWLFTFLNSFSLILFFFFFNNSNSYLVFLHIQFICIKKVNKYKEKCIYFLDKFLRTLYVSMLLL